MAKSFQISEHFIASLVENGVVPEGTTHVIIDAKVGRIVELHFTTLEIDSDKLRLMAESVQPAEVIDEQH